jgi:hypothetical protein
MKFIPRYLGYHPLIRLCSQHTCVTAVYDTAEKFHPVTLDSNRALPGVPRTYGISSKGNTTYKSKVVKGE